MKRTMRYKAIVFDMDNTLLRSNIDFPRLKREVFAFLVERRIFAEDFPLGDHTIATLIEAARAANLSADLEAAVWDIVACGEREGMAGAQLEPYVPEMLHVLQGNVHMTVLTNNALPAALDALDRTGVRTYFDHIAGREQMSALKPSPSGLFHLLSFYPDLRREEWLAVGDAWIDGKAAQQAGVSFLAYNARMDELERRRVPVIGHIRSMRELADYIFDNEVR